LPAFFDCDDIRNLKMSHANTLAAENHSTPELNINFDSESTGLSPESLCSPLLLPLQLLDYNSMHILSGDSSESSLVFEHSHLKPTSKEKAIRECLNMLCKACLSLLDVMLYVLEESKTHFHSYSLPFFNSEKFSSLLYLLWRHTKGFQAT